MTADKKIREIMTSREIPITDEQDTPKAQEENSSGKDENVHEEIVENPDVAAEKNHDEMIRVLEERVRELETETEGLREQRLRAIAELDNARRRAQQDVLNTVRYANEDLLKKFLPIVDDFNRSVESGAETKDFNSFFEGITLIKNKLMKLLEELDVKQIEALGEPFNVDFHEALMRQPSDKPEDTVVAELEPGYLYKDKVIRHTKVIVSAGE